MEELKVKPIEPIIYSNKNVRKSMQKKIIKSAYDRKRKKSKENVKQRIYYLWFHYLKLCLNLEEINAISKYGLNFHDQAEKFHGSVGVFLENRINRALPAAFIGTKQFLGGRDAGFGNLK